MNTDYFIIGLLGVILLYLIIRDITITRKRKITHVMVKRCSRKIDTFTGEIRKQNKLMNSLLKILSRED